MDKINFLKKIDYNSLLICNPPQHNPWRLIQQNFNENFNENLSIEQIVDLYQKSNCNYFYSTYPISDKINSYFTDKKVIIVGPSKYLEGKGFGSFIDTFDIVIRLDVNYLNTNINDFGKKLSIFSHNLNNCCRPSLETYLNNNDNPKPDFIISSDSSIGNGKYIYDIKYDFEKKYNIPIIDLEINKKYNYRNKLYWEINSTKYIEKYNNQLINYIGNFSSGYGVINMILRYKIKELYILGMDFYNIGLSNNSPDRYISNYFETIFNNKTSLKSKLNGGIHNSLAQVNHMRNVLLKNDSRLKIDDHLRELLYNKETEERINKYINHI